MQSLVVAVVDVGAPQNIGWWRQVEGDGRGGTNLDELGLLLAEDLNAGRSVALGFEAPMFIPRPFTADRLSRGRVGEGRWPWSGGPGTSVLASGIQQSTYLLSTLRVNVERLPQVGYDLAVLAGPYPRLVVWERSCPAMRRIDWRTTRTSTTLVLQSPSSFGGGTTRRCRRTSLTLELRVSPASLYWSQASRRTSGS